MLIAYSLMQRRMDRKYINQLYLQRLKRTDLEELAD